MHSFASCLIHCVWSTKNREPWLIPDLRERLWPYLGGIAKQNQMKVLAIGGAADHVHVLLSLPATLSVAKAVQLLKGNSSKMDSRNISQDAFLRLAGRLRRIQRWYLWRGCNRDLYQQSNRASPEAIFSRGVHSDASEAPFRIRGINTRLKRSVVPAGTRCVAKPIYPALKRWAIFKNALMPVIAVARAADDLCPPPTS